MKDWLDKIESYGGAPINTSLFAVLIPFDNIGKVAYSTNFGSVRTGRDLPMLSLIETLFKTIGTLGHLDWPLPLTADLGLGKEQIQFEDIAVRMIDERDKVRMTKAFVENKLTYACHSVARKALKTWSNIFSKILNRQSQKHSLTVMSSTRTRRPSSLAERKQPYLM